MYKIHIKPYFVWTHIPLIILPSFRVLKELTFSWIGKQYSVCMNTLRFRWKRKLNWCHAASVKIPYGLCILRSLAVGALCQHIPKVAVCKTSELNPANTQCTSIFFSAYLFFRICFPLLHTVQFTKRLSDLVLWKYVTAHCKTTFLHLLFDWILFYQSKIVNYYVWIKK